MPADVADAIFGQSLMESIANLSTKGAQRWITRAVEEHAADNLFGDVIGPQTPLEGLERRARYNAITGKYASSGLTALRMFQPKDTSNDPARFLLQQQLDLHV